MEDALQNAKTSAYKFIFRFIVQEKCKGVTNFNFKTQGKHKFNLNEQVMEISLNKENFIKSILNKFADFGSAIVKSWESPMRQPWN